MSIQLKRSLTRELDSSYVLKQGQIGIEMPSSTNTSSSAFRFKIGDGQTAWSSLPYAAATDPHTHSEYLTTTGTAASATKLSTARTIRVNLGSTSSASFNGTSNVTPGVTGTLPVTNGGTGVTTISALKAALGIGSGSSSSSAVSSYAWIDPIDDYPAILINVPYGVDTPSDYPTDARNKINNCTNLSHIAINRPAPNEYNSYPTEHTISMNGAIVYINAKGGNSGVSSASFTFGPKQLQVGSNYVNYTGLFVGSYGGNAYCGYTNYAWKAVYSTTGSIQTSSRSAKHDIVYLSEAKSVTADNLQDTNVEDLISLEDVVAFVNSFDPCTFVYDSSDGPHVEDYQLGIVADDIADLKIFPYVGTVQDITNEETGKAETHYALKAIPLAVAALTACKYLMQRVEMLEETAAS